MATSAIAAGAASLAGTRVPRARAGTKPAGGRAALSVRAHGPGGGQHLTPEVRLDPRFRVVPAAARAPRPNVSLSSGLREKTCRRSFFSFARVDLAAARTRR